jgi:hypothetical protein
VNPRAAGLIIAGVVVVVLLLVGLAIWWVGRQAGVRRSEFRRASSELDLVVSALERIDEAADTHRDLFGADGALASQVRQIVRETRQKRNKIT